MSRRALFFWILVWGLIAAATGLVALALSVVLPTAPSALAALTLMGLASTRLPLLKRDPPRARWIVLALDLPAFVVLLSGILALPVFALSVSAAGFSQLIGFKVPLGSTTLALASWCAGLLLAAWGVYGEPRRLSQRRHEVDIANLPVELDGYRLVHLSDLHLGSFTTEARAALWVAAANAFRADAVAVTGDLVSAGSAHYALAARVLGRLRAHDGVFVCLGNHDTYDSATFTERLEAQGLCVLRDTARIVRPTRCPQSSLVLAGLDALPPRRHPIDDYLAKLPRGLPTVLLAHYPEHAQRLAPDQVSIMLAGHTHGGQLGIPGLGARWNLAILTGQAPARLVRLAASWLHVSAGLGTSGPPIRLGVPPEITLLVLRTTALTGRFDV